jgi:hypothetical protein
LYAQQYMTGAEVVVRHLFRLSDTALARQAGQMLRNPGLLLDLYGSADDEEYPAPMSDSDSRRIIANQEGSDG